MRNETPLVDARRRAALVTLALLVLTLWFVPPGDGATAQEATPADAAAELSPTPLPAPVSSFLNAEADVASLPPGPVTISMTTVAISPRVALRAIVTNGPVLILVDAGELTVDAEAALIGPPPASSLSSLQPAGTPVPAPVANLTVLEGNQIVLPPETRVQLRNTTDSQVELTIVAIAPEGEEGFGQPAD